MAFLGVSGFKSTVLVTGGASGIGLALAKSLVGLGHEVVVVGRRQHQLDFAESECPQLKSFQADVSSEEGRKALYRKVKLDFPNINVLINNAGVNLPEPLIWKKKEEDWMSQKNILGTNLEAPMHLSSLFAADFIKQPHSLITNVSAIVAFAPLACCATYSATKAGLHSFSQSLRHQLKNTSVRVVEIVPPAVDTGFMPSMKRIAVQVEPFAQHVITQMLEGKEEITWGTMEKITQGGRKESEGMFKAINPEVKV